MKRNYFIILCLLLVSSFVFAQKEATVKDPSGPPLSLTYGKDQRPYSPLSPAVAKSTMPAPGDNILFSEDFNTDFGGTNYAPAAWDSYNFDSGYIWDYYIGGSIMGTRPSYWMGALTYNQEDFFAVSFSALVTSSLGAYNSPADDWLVTPAITIGATGKDVVLFFDTQSMDASYLDGIQIWVIENSAYDAIATKTSDALVNASTMIYSSTAEPASWVQRGALLNAYKGKDVRVMFRNNGFKNFAIALDNVYISLEEGVDPDDMNKVRNLTAIQDGFHVNLSWELDLDIEISEFGWASGSQTVVTGMHGGTDNIHVSRFTPEDLTQYNGKSLGGLRFGILNNSGANVTPANVAYTIHVYEGGSLGDPGTLVLEQQVTSWEMGWNDVLFNSPVTIDASKELWFGFKMEKLNDVTSYPVNTVRTNSLGTEIPYVANKSDVIYIDGEWTTWTDMTADGTSPNSPVWAFAGLIVEEASGAPVLVSHLNPKPEKKFILDEDNNLKTFKKINANPEVLQSINAMDMGSAKQIGAKAIVLPTGYNIYRDGKLMGTTRSTSYTDEFVINGGILYNYCVTAKYGAYGSESEQVCKSILFEEIPAATELSTSFEGFTYGQPADGWTITGNGGADWEFNDTWDEFYGLLGDPSPFEDGSYTWFDGMLWYEGGISYLTTPYIMPTAEKSNLRFELRNGLFSDFIASLVGMEFNAALAPDFKVNVSADQGRTWTTVYDIKTEFPGYPYVDISTIVDIDLSAYVDMPVFIQFFAQCNKNTGYIAMDNIELVEKYDGPCQPVTGLTAVQGDDTNTVTISWDAFSLSPAIKPSPDKDARVADPSMQIEQKHAKRAKSGKGTWITHFEDGLPYTWDLTTNSYLSGTTLRYAWMPADQWGVYGTPPAESFFFFNAFNYSPSDPACLVSHEFAVTDDAKELIIEIQEMMMNPNYVSSGEAVYIDYSEDGGATWAEGTENILASLTGYNSATTYVTEQVYDLSAYVGKRIKVRFRGVSDYGGCVAVLHSAEFPEGPPPPPTYTLSRNGVVIAEGITETSYVDEDVNATGTYVYSLTMFLEDDNCTSDPAHTALDFTSICDLYPITNLVAVQDNKYITLNWSNPSRGSYFNEGFENGFANWTNVDADGDGYGWTNSNIYYRTGAYSAMSFSFYLNMGTARPDNWLIRSFELEPDTKLSYWLRQHAALYAEKYGVYIATEDPLTGGFDASKFTELLVEAPSTTVWDKREIDLSAYGTQKVWIAFRNFDTYNQWAIYIDDVQLSNAWDAPKNVYRDGELIASGVMGTSYVDKLRVSGTHNYCVSIPIENCETVPDCTGDVFYQVGEINTEFPDNVLPYQWEIILGDDAKWEFADTYAARDMEDAYVPFADGDGTFVWFNAAYWDYNDYSYLVSPVFEPIASENILAFDLAAVKTVMATQAGHGAGLYVDVLVPEIDNKNWIKGTVNYLAAIPGYNRASHNTDLAFMDLSAYMGEDIKVRFRAVSDHGSFVTALDNVRLTATKDIYDCNLNPVTDLTATVESNGVSLLWDAPAKGAVATNMIKSDAPVVDPLKKSSPAKAITTFPYKEEFTTNACDWLAIDATNNIGLGVLTYNDESQATPLSPPSYVLSGFDSYASRNAWVISPAIQMEAGQTYTISLYTCIPGYGGNLDEFKVTVGTAQTEASQTTIIIDKTGSNAMSTDYHTFAKVTGTFTPETSGEYYFGINHCTAVFDVNGVGFEDFMIEEGGAVERVALFEESFEDGATGWATIDADGDGHNWGLTTTGAYDGEYYVTSASFDNSAGELTPDNWLISPAVSLNGKEASLTYAISAQDADWPAEKYAVYISTTDTNIGSFTQLFEEIMTAAPANKSGKEIIGKNDVSKAQGSWYVRTIDLSAYDGQTVYIAFRHYDCTDWFRLNLDAINITVLPTEFGENDNPLTYTVTRNGAIIAEGLTSVSYKDTGIDVKEYATYEYAVIAVQGLCTSDETTVIVEIGPDCDRNKVTTLVANVDNDVVKLDWNAYDRSVTEAYDVYENGVKIAEAVTANSLDIIPTITGNIDYCVVALSANCESEPACSNVYYSPTNLSKVNGKVAVYPTVTTGLITIETLADANVKVTDISGRILKTAESTGKLQLDLNYSNGVYLIVVDVEGTVSTHKVVVKK